MTRFAGRRVAAASFVLLALLTAACGDNDGDAGSESASSDTDADSDSQDSTEPTSTTDAAPPEVGARPSAGCGVEGAPAAVVEEERTLTVAGVDRRYLLTVPSAHDGAEPLPIVFSFHGLLEGAEIHALTTQYSALAEEEGVVAVFPHGTGDPVRWETGLDPEADGDLVYFDAVLEEIAAELCIDEARVYATGLSNGAMFTSALLCQRADVLAAAAPVAGIVDPEGCEPSRPVPLVSFHGTEDGILLFNGGVDVSSIPGVGDPDAAPTTTAAPVDLDGEGYPATGAAFAARNGCEPEPDDTEVTPEVIHRVFPCPAGADVELYIVVGGGHSWPASEFSASIGEIVGPTTDDIDATRDAFAFMRRFANRGS